MVFPIAGISYILGVIFGPTLILQYFGIAESRIEFWSLLVFVMLFVLPCVAFIVRLFWQEAKEQIDIEDQKTMDILYSGDSRGKYK